MEHHNNTSLKFRKNSTRIHEGRNRPKIKDWPRTLEAGPFQDVPNTPKMRSKENRRRNGTKMDDRMLDTCQTVPVHSGFSVMNPNS